ncbi:ADP-dependent glucokinase-like [Apostichopus japonicus]|uniref:ADP-dependent glucokinase-like n=1 Tax=Stichopus japonicus TaxID=307972 RepID=UPI003AB84268
MIPKTILFGLVIILIAYYYDPIVWKRLVKKLLKEEPWEVRIANAWDQQITEPHLQKKRIAVGVNVNADLIVSGTELFEKLNLRPSGKREDHSVLRSLADLEETFSFYFEKGAGVERFFADQKGFNDILQAAHNLKEKHYFVGGNAALIALTIASSFPDVEILLIGPTGPKVQSLLSSNIRTPASSRREQDEVHLILEYSKGEVWGDAVTPVATRFITSHDIANSEMEALAGFAENVQAFNPDVVVFSGLHLLDGQEPEFQAQRISNLLDQLDQLPKHIPVHLELASMADKNLVTQLFSQVVGQVHSLGLNEQELSLIAKVTGLANDLAVTKGHPEIPQVADILVALLRSKRKSTLTRIHFHCLTYHIIATRKGSWSNTASAVAAGTRVAGMQACQDETIVPDKVELRVPKRAIAISDSPMHGDRLQFQPDKPTLKWEISNIEIYFSPVLVCKEPLKTVGLGDAISGTGLVYSDFVS